MVYLVILMDLEPLDLEFFISVNEAGLWLVDLKLLLCCVGLLALRTGPWMHGFSPCSHLLWSAQ